MKFNAPLPYDTPSPYELYWMTPDWKIKDSAVDSGVNILDVLKFTADGTILRGAQTWGKGSYSNGKFTGTTNSGTFTILREVVGETARLSCTITFYQKANLKHSRVSYVLTSPPRGSSWTAEAGSGGNTP